ncbi:MAG: ERCC4 domain-containing protein [Lachnospiraceae bacterium]|nr:ERCC4 domain-containing protein [Lachnospiraceae bacterium]
MVIQIDSREKARAVRNIVAEFDRAGINHPVSKLMVGDYMNYDNPRLVVDRKQNLTELCCNVCQDHERFRNEIVRANENGIKLVFLVEHGDGIECLEDVIFWENPRRKKRRCIDGHWQTVETKATTGETLYNILTTIRQKYGVEFVFCRKEDTGRKIMELLANDS